MSNHELFMDDLEGLERAFTRQFKDVAIRGRGIYRGFFGSSLNRRKTSIEVRFRVEIKRMDSPNKNWGCFFSALAFGILGTLAGIGTLYYVLISPYLLRQKTADWEETQCVIRESSVEQSFHKRPGERHKGFYTIVVKYNYRYRGRDYTSDKYDFYQVSTGERKWKEAVVEKLPPGTETVCYVNPDHPSEAVLSRAKNVGFVTAIPGALFLLVGLFALYAAFCGDLMPSRAAKSQ
jgi:hypothetical protein